MVTPGDIVNEINSAIGSLVNCGLSGDQNGAILRTLRDRVTEVTFRSDTLVASSAVRHDYKKSYEQLREARAYNILMPDGAMIQLMYEFSNNIIQKHKLAFCPSPFLEEFQNDPELYLLEEIYADVIERSVVTFPLRFDYDANVDNHIACHHPMSHLTLGQYKNCRIPVSSPLSPILFLDFILRSFYNTAFRKYSEVLPASNLRFDSCIHPEERKLSFISVPA